MHELEERLRTTIRDVPDFPKPGILFKDITPVLADPKLFRATIDWFAELYAGEHIDAVVGMESRGFLFGAPLALELSAAFVPARKPGKLPYDRISEQYSLEYGTATLEMHVDAVKPGDRVLIVDDLLATGGTAKATCKLVKQLGADIVGMCFVVELGFLSGRALLDDVPVHAIITY
ncbi:MAG: adenine phosphoribosyltransferase [Oligoflexia bacterium]|nr:adenine phosphoribosyltransferase [Oligoflexia bacterium]